MGSGAGTGDYLRVIHSISEEVSFHLSLSAWYHPIHIPFLMPSLDLSSNNDLCSYLSPYLIYPVIHPPL